MRLVTRLILVAAVVAACGGDGGAATTTLPPTTTLASTTSSEAPSTTTTSVLGTTTTTTIPAVDVTVANGVVEGPPRFEFAIGEQVEITVLADVADEIHVHAYDLFFETEPGVPTSISFPADVQGVFDVEMESNHLPLFELVVNP